MKKFLIFLFSSLFLLSLAACSNQDKDIQQDIDQANKNKNTDIDIESVEGNNNTDQSTDDSDEHLTNSSENDSNKSDTSNEYENISDEITDFDEFQELDANISEIDNLKTDIKTDNSNKRVILFVDENNHKQYKSIFIKHKEHLKIIELNKDDGLLFNDKI